MYQQHMLHSGITSMGQFQCVPTTYVTEIKETYFEIYTKGVSCLSALPLLSISNCRSVLKYLSIVYIYMTAISPNLISCLAATCPVVMNAMFSVQPKNDALWSFITLN